MNFKNLLDKVAEGLDWLEKFGPLAASLGFPQVNVGIAVVNSLTEIIENIGKRAEEAGEVFSTEDQARIQELTARLAAENDALNQYIRDHPPT